MCWPKGGGSASVPYGSKEGSELKWGSWVNNGMLQYKAYNQYSNMSVLNKGLV